MLLTNGCATVLLSSGIAHSLQLVIFVVPGSSATSRANIFGTKFGTDIGTTFAAKLERLSQLGMPCQQWR